MDAISISVASGMRARQESLDLLANNIANTATAGFKLDRELNNQYLSPDTIGAIHDGIDLPPAVLPVLERHWTDFSQGLLTETGNPLHLALSGKGFLSVQAPQGVLYTRNGSLRISSKGILETIEGYAVRSAKGQPIKLDPAVQVEVSKDGSIRQNGAEVARLDVAEFTEPQSLSKLGHTYFLWSPPAPAADAKATALVPRPARDFEIHQGKLEGSNVTPAESAVKLVSVMRQFEMLQRALSLTGEMGRRAVEDVARVGN